MRARLLAIVPMLAVAACRPTAGKGAGETARTLPEARSTGAGTGAGTGSEILPPDTDPWAGRTDLVQAPQPLAPAPYRLPKLARFRLPNGLQVVVVENHQLPVTSFHLAIGAGEEDEPQARRSIASFAARMLTKGTRMRSADVIAETIDYVGGSLAARATLENTHVTCQSLAKDAGICLSLVADAVANPTFPKNEMAEVRDKLVAEVKRVRDDASALAAEHFDNALWGENHVRGWPVTVETVQSITRDDLVAWHKQQIVPGGAILAIAGDVDPKLVRTRVTKAFARWKRGASPRARRQVARPPAVVKVRLVDKPDQTQSHIRVGHQGIAHADPTYFPTVVMNYTLGGGAFSSRLMKVVRSEGGKTYGASSSFERTRERGEFVATTFTRTSETVATLQLVLRELERMRAEGPSAAELAAAQANLAGSYPLGFETASDVASAVLSAELHRLGDAYVRDYAVRVAGVSLEQARAAAAKRLDPEHATVVIVGNAKEVGPQLERAGIPFETVGWMEPIARRDRDAARAAGYGPADPKRTEQGRRILDLALAAKGGEARLAGLKDVVYRGKARLPAQNIEGSLTRTFVPPDRLALEIQVPQLQGTLAITVTEKGAWTRFGPQAARPLPAPMASEARTALWRDRDTVLLRHREDGTYVQSLGKKPLGSREVDVVEIAKQDRSARTTLWLDPATHDLLRMDYQEGGAPAFEEFADYREVDGIRFAFDQKKEGEGQKIQSAIDEVKVNGGVSPAAFESP